MFSIFIFGGTSEGRLLAEFCSKNKVNYTVSTATEYGSSLLPHSANVIFGRLDCIQMSEKIVQSGCGLVIDATHPYACETTENIKKACKITGTEYCRVKRESCEVWGDTAESIEKAVEMINSRSGTVLSTLGSNSLEKLTGVNNYCERVWVRILPSEGAVEMCTRLGYDINKVICERGPFSTEQNIVHIRQSGAEILLTKESGKAGGYTEKAESAKRCGISMITVKRPVENGISLIDAEKIIMSAVRCNGGESV